LTGVPSINSTSKKAVLGVAHPDTRRCPVILDGVVVLGGALFAPAEGCPGRF
jgi:hypothetical protein